MVAPEKTDGIASSSLSYLTDLAGAFAFTRLKATRFLENLADRCFSSAEVPGSIDIPDTLFKTESDLRFGPRFCPEDLPGNGSDDAVAEGSPDAPSRSDESRRQRRGEGS
jgi:hypothetical protein